MDILIISIILYAIIFFGTICIMIGGTKKTNRRWRTNKLFERI